MGRGGLNRMGDALAARARAPRRALRALARAWRFVREVSGDAAYETYARHAGDGALSREEFWLDALRRRYDRVSRCC